MNELKHKHLRPCGIITDQFVIASLIATLVLTASTIVFPTGITRRFFAALLGGDQDAGSFLNDYFSFIIIWIGMFLVVILFRFNRPMLHAVKYWSPRVRGAGSVSGRKGNRAGNNIGGLVIGLALGFGCNGFCILMSVLLGDIHIEYSGFELLPFVVFFLCVFIQSAAEELTDRWYLYQKLRRRYKAPWVAIFVNAFVFMALHLFNPGITFLACAQIFVVGVVFSLLVYYYNGLWIACAFHAAWNFTQSIFFGLPNSGIVSAYSVFRLDAASAVDGPFYTVNFGVEGSPGAVVVLILVGLFIFLKNRGKGEHTDIWAKAEQAAIEKAEEA